MEEKTRSGFTLYHDDIDMLAYASPESFKRAIVSMNNYSKSLDDSQHSFSYEKFDGMLQGLYQTMTGKIKRDRGKYEERKREQTIKGIMTSIYAEYEAHGKQKPAKEVCRILAEERYSKSNGIATASHSQPRPTIVGHSETDMERGDETDMERESGYEAELESGFSPPTVKVVESYANENGLKDDAEKFVMYYSANGWRHKGESMYDWKSAYHLWLKRGEEYENRTQKKLAAQDYEQREYREEEMAENLGVDDLFERRLDNGQE